MHDESCHVILTINENGLVTNIQSDAVREADTQEIEILK
jgi:hypothetical protein